MKEFKNENLKDSDFAQSTGLKDFKDLALVCLNVKAEGMDLREMRNRFKVIDKLETITQDGQIVELEDSEHETLVNAINSTVWRLSSRSLLDFEDMVKG